MSENASHVFIHHYIENSSSFNCAGVACCIILIVIVVILFLIVAGFMIYILVYLNRHRPSRRPRRPATTRQVHGYDNKAIDDVSSSCNAATAAPSTERDDVLDDDNNAQSIPMTTFRKSNRTRAGQDRCKQDTSESSAGLYDVLFPDQNEGDVIYDPPTKLMTIAGQVFASGLRPDVGPVAGPSGLGLTPRARGDTDSLVWDYFQPGGGATPADSEIGSEVDPDRIENICWV